MEPFKRRLRSKTKADECKEHDRAKECGRVRINPETALLPFDAPRPQLRLVWQDQEQFKEEEGTKGYKRPDAGKRPKTHSGATGSSRYRKSGGNKQSTGRATSNQRMKREGPWVRRGRWLLRRSRRKSQRSVQLRA